MQGKDLRSESPRRWCEEIEGIVWLPRLIDKAAAALSGTLGDYFFGQSPIDRGLLRSLGLGHRAFADIVRNAAGDQDVLDALRARDARGLERARMWGSNLRRRLPLFLFGLDVDDGYANGGWRLAKGPTNVATRALAWTVKRLWPSHAAEPRSDA